MSLNCVRLLCWAWDSCRVGCGVWGKGWIDASDAALILTPPRHRRCCADCNGRQRHGNKLLTRQPRPLMMLHSLRRRSGRRKRKPRPTRKPEKLGARRARSGGRWVLWPRCWTMPTRTMMTSMSGSSMAFRCLNSAGTATTAWRACSMTQILEPVATRFVNRLLALWRACCAVLTRCHDAPGG